MLSLNVKNHHQNAKTEHVSTVGKSDTGLIQTVLVVTKSYHN